jgi:hypothetical protein
MEHNGAFLDVETLNRWVQGGQAGSRQRHVAHRRATGVIMISPTNKADLRGSSAC